MDFFNIRDKLIRCELEVRGLQERLAEAIDLRNTIQETCDRKIREVEHKLGLDRKRHELELEEATIHGAREAEDKLLREKDRHIESMLATINKHHEEIISRLPTVHVDRQIKLKGA